MTLPSPPSLLDWRALLLVAVACASPGRAAAGCGDHVVVLTPGITHGGTSRAVESGDLPKPPCPGPGCSRAPDRPAPPLAPAPSSHHGKEAAHDRSAATPDDRAASRPPEFTCPRPSRRPASIFHPPRAG